MESWYKMKNKIIIMFLILALLGCSKKSEDNNPKITFDSEFTKDKIAFKSTNIIDEYKKLDPKYKIEHEYYAFKINHVKITLGEYEDNLGITAISLEADKIDADRLFSEINNLRTRLNISKITKTQFNETIKKMKKSDNVDIIETNMGIQSVKGQYFVTINSFITT